MADKIVFVHIKYASGEEVKLTGKSTSLTQTELLNLLAPEIMSDYELLLRASERERDGKRKKRASSAPAASAAAQAPEPFSALFSNLERYKRQVAAAAAAKAPAPAAEAEPELAAEPPAAADKSPVYTPSSPKYSTESPAYHPHAPSYEPVTFKPLHSPCESQDN